MTDWLKNWLSDTDENTHNPNPSLNPDPSDSLLGNWAQIGNAAGSIGSAWNGYQANKLRRSQMEANQNNFQANFNNQAITTNNEIKRRNEAYRRMWGGDSKQYAKVSEKA